MNAAEQIVNTQEFATLPSVATKILEFIDFEDVSLSDLGKVMESDPSLTMKIIKISNSPLYATRVEVNNINQAIATLGLNRVSIIVLGVSIFSKFMVSSDKKLSEFIDEFWTHSASTGIVAKSIAAKIGGRFGEKEFLTGLIHDIGKLAMIQYSPEKYFEVVQSIENEKRYCREVEKEIFGIDNLDILKLIGEKWRLPEDLSRMITLEINDSYDKISNDVIAVVDLANKLCEIWGSDFHEGLFEIEIGETDSWKYLQENYESVRDFDVEAFTFELEEEFKNSSDFLDMIKS